MIFAVILLAGALVAVAGGLFTAAAALSQVARILSGNDIRALAADLGRASERLGRVVAANQQGEPKQ